MKRDGGLHAACVHAGASKASQDHALRIDISRFSSELTVAKLEKDTLAQQLEHSGSHAKELFGEMQSMTLDCIQTVVSVHAACVLGSATIPNFERSGKHSFRHAGRTSA